MLRGSLFAVFFNGMLVYAQESAYDQMKYSLDANSLPLVNMIVDSTQINRTDYVPGEIEIADYSRRTNPKAEVVRYLCKYRIRGGSAVSQKKKSYAVKLCDKNGGDLDANIFGIREENSWILDAMAIDRIRMRNRICFDVWNELSHTPYNTKYDGRNGTRGQFVEVFINGNYNGLYCMTDKIDRKLLGLKKVILSGESDVTVRGLLYKGISWGTGYNLRSYAEADVDKAAWNAWELQYPDDYPSINTWQPLMDLIDFCSDKTSLGDFRSDWENWFYKDNLADYAVFTLALGVGDNAYKNTFLSTVNINAGHKYLLSPWDMDMSLGGNWDGEYNEELVKINRYSGIAPFNRLTTQNIDGFKDLQRSKWAENYETLFSIENVSRRMEDYEQQFTLSGAWEREYAKWNGNPVMLKENLGEELEYVKDWYAKNYENLCSQFGLELPTSISTIMEGNKQSPQIYSLDGRRIEAGHLSRGIYIINGKKLMVQ